MKIHVVKLSTIVNCPLLIFDVAHFRLDGTCRCDEKPDSRKRVGDA